MQTAIFVIGALTLVNSTAVVYLLWPRRRHVTISTEVSRDGDISPVVQQVVRSEVATAMRRYDENLSGARLLNRVDHARSRLN